MAVEKLIVDHIDTWTTALQTRSTAGRGSSGKIDLYGIKKLRELILELAVRGKLVPQDPNDEPASVLLKRIAAEKAELVKQGKIKKPKPLPEISEEEKPFELPKGWEWVRLGGIAEIIRGVTYTKNQCFDVKTVGTIALLRANNIQEQIVLDPLIYVDANIVSKEQLLLPGDILIAMSSGSEKLVGKAAQIKDKIEASFGAFCGTIRPLSTYISNFLGFYLQTPTYRIQTQELGKGIGIKNLNKTNLELILVAIPSSNLMEKILTSCSQLFELCAQLEQHSLTSLDAHQQLVETLLTTLTDSQNAEELAENWARISEHFDTLFTTEASIDALKQTILQLAVMGKITTPKISPSTKNKNTTAQSNSIFSDLVQYIPAHWNLCTLDQISAAIIDCPHSTPKWTEQGFICVRTNQFKPGHLDLNNSRYVSEQTYIERTQRLEPSYGDILYSREGGILGVACRVPEKIKICLGQRMMLIRPKENITSEYLEIVLNSPLITSLAQKMTTGGAAPRINVSTVKGYPIPYPPIEEQNQIIEKINELNGVCEQLRSQIQSAQQTQLHLADALTDAAIN
ncbi:restriction endonuclease subunit S [Klebsiella michiganensis]|uniref:restriction endonuclease subunit S n=1 Tax=Klebsiella michiganensis TaxID=1134687 RepID=UPI000CE670FB|nr:restriction endonuclease subunit S [Klebsiella michiganensis]AVE79313.1 restriction endonuclease [Klebsiella oxytoca]MBZ7332846.1 restriction endonuclease subunit S [Klebsiella michiganensis]MDM4568935.1 restriction endonuclease subunit S [Klebsiella michiganensis]MDM4586358.1 restriction endonuclease subunit S [Klebsiella michiganensis]